MTKKQIQEFTRRITHANRSGLTLIKFEMLFVYFDDIVRACQENDRQAMTDGVHHADAVLKSFQETLDFQYEISAQLYALYDFHRRQLSKVIIKNSAEGLDQSREMLLKTYHAFQEAAKQDTSGPLMRNAQQVYAGYTYGKHDLNESYDLHSSRGFLA
ncbi:MAG: flagellar protein FliS [Eubacterium sp.]|jgi:flagellar protein FliS|nr:flagellar protein FliS [Eubacterium sp.]